jgi:hypothetical protein
MLLYLNLPEAERVALPERSPLEQRLRGGELKKAVRTKLRMATTYDPIVILQQPRIAAQISLVSTP